MASPSSGGGTWDGTQRIGSRGAGGARLVGSSLTRKSVINRLSPTLAPPSWHTAALANTALATQPLPFLLLLGTATVGSVSPRPPAVTSRFHPLVSPFWHSITAFGEVGALGLLPWGVELSGWGRVWGPPGDKEGWLGSGLQGGGFG